MEFSLFDELGQLSAFAKYSILFCLAVSAILIALLIRSKKADSKESVISGKSGAQAVVYGALCVAIGFVLSYLKLFSLPQGGSITVASMLPVAIYGYWFGLRNGLIAGFAIGALQFIQEPIAVHWLQPILDYILAFGCIGLSGLFRKNLTLGVLVGGVGRILFSVLSGVLFFTEYAPEGMNVWLYSFVYNFSVLGPDVVICAVIAILPPMAMLVKRLRPAAK